MLSFLHNQSKILSHITSSIMTSRISTPRANAGANCTIAYIPLSSCSVIRLRIKAFQGLRSVKASAGNRPAVLAASVVDDKSVPEAHKGLHNFLYGESGADEHDQDRAYSVRKGEDEGGAVMPVPAYLESRDGEKPLGVYCVYDSNLHPQYIGYSRNMVLAIKGHLSRMGPTRAAHVRAMVYRNQAMTSRTNLERGVSTWVSELLGGVVPPGNSDPAQRALWEGTSSTSGTGSEGPGEASGSGGAAGMVGSVALDRSLMSPAELAAYEEKKLKMRKAMGEKMVEGAQGGDHHHHHDEEVEEDMATRRQKLMAAMNRGDWSAVIDQQTKEALAQFDDTASTVTPTSSATSTTDGASSGAAENSASGDGASGSGEGSSGRGDGEAASGGAGVVSPFERDAAAVGAAARGGSGSGDTGRQPLTVAAVQAALEEVRPYLMADGGDVEVVDVTDGVVYLRLQGACSSCPSQGATMKGGIERVIKQTFGDQVRDILQLDAVDPGATVERVDAALNMLRGAISNLGGSVEVVSVEGGVATLRYKGPPAIGKGVQGAVKDSFHDLKEVRLVD